MGKIKKITVVVNEVNHNMWCQKKKKKRQKGIKQKNPNSPLKPVHAAVTRNSRTSQQHWKRERKWNLKPNTAHRYAAVQTSHNLRLAADACDTAAEGFVVSR